VVLRIKKIKIINIRLRRSLMPVSIIESYSIILNGLDIRIIGSSII